MIRILIAEESLFLGSPITPAVVNYAIVTRNHHSTALGRSTGYVILQSFESLNDSMNRTEHLYQLGIEVGRSMLPKRQFRNLFQLSKYMGIYPTELKAFLASTGMVIDMNTKYLAIGRKVFVSHMSSKEIVIFNGECEVAQSLLTEAFGLYYVYLDFCNRNGLEPNTDFASNLHRFNESDEFKDLLSINSVYIPSLLNLVSGFGNFESVIFLALSAEREVGVGGILIDNYKAALLEKFIYDYKIGTLIISLLNNMRSPGSSNFDMTLREVKNRILEKGFFNAHNNDHIGAGIATSAAVGEVKVSSIIVNRVYSVLLDELSKSVLSSLVVQSQQELTQEIADAIDLVERIKNPN